MCFLSRLNHCTYNDPNFTPLFLPTSPHNDRKMKEHHDKMVLAHIDSDEWMGKWMRCFPHVYGTVEEMVADTPSLPLARNPCKPCQARGGPFLMVVSGPAQIQISCAKYVFSVTGSGLNAIYATWSSKPCFVTGSWRRKLETPQTQVVDRGLLLPHVAIFFPPTLLLA